MMTNGQLADYLIEHKIISVQLIEYDNKCAEAKRTNIPKPMCKFNTKDQVKQVLSEVYKFGEWRGSDKGFICNYVKNDIAFVLEVVIK